MPTKNNGMWDQEVRRALVEYIDNGETIDEEEMEKFIAEKLKAKGIALK